MPLEAHGDVMPIQRRGGVGKARIGTTRPQHTSKRHNTIRRREVRIGTDRHAVIRARRERRNTVVKMGCYNTVYAHV
jgi:hypothetical protein